jgi:hypothetical protein
VARHKCLLFIAAVSSLEPQFFKPACRTLVAIKCAHRKIQIQGLHEHLHIKRRSRSDILDHQDRGDDRQLLAAVRELLEGEIEYPLEPCWILQIPPTLAGQIPPGETDVVHPQQAAWGRVGCLPAGWIRRDVCHFINVRKEANSLERLHPVFPFFERLL